MKRQHLFFLLLCSMFISCHSLKMAEQNPNKQAILYEQAIVNSMSPSSQKISDNLVVIDKNNKNLIWKNIDGEDYILTVTWKQNVSYYEAYLDSAHYNTGNYPIWITTAPELHRKMNEKPYKDVELRLKQLLGLPPNSVYSYFVEFWVRPADLFRPCPDNEINDATCDLHFPPKTDSTHISWINDNRISRYYQEDLFSKYPWTQLGYTYDWYSRAKKQKHVGLSEFVIRADKNIVVNAIYTTEEYLKSKK